MNYYVYVYLDIRKEGKYQYNEYEFNYEPFYIGKGCGNRAHSHMQKILSENCKTEHNKYKINKSRKILRETGKEPLILIYKEHMSEVEAFSLEWEMISAIGKNCDNAGPLTNFADGGLINHGLHITRETRKKISISLKQCYEDNKIPRIKSSSFKQGHKNNIKKWIVTDPVGEKHIIEDLLQFCKSNNISKSLYKGKWKKWKAEKYIGI